MFKRFGKIDRILPFWEQKPAFIMYSPEDEARAAYTALKDYEKRKTVRRLAAVSAVCVCVCVSDAAHSMRRIRVRSFRRRSSPSFSLTTPITMVRRHTHTHSAHTHSIAMT